MNNHMDKTKETKSKSTTTKSDKDATQAKKEQDDTFQVNGVTFKRMTGATGHGFVGGVRPPKPPKEARQRTTASGVVIRNVTKSGAGIGIVGQSLKSEKPN